jgi:predicted DNA-binding transcriptional regulator AlpA
LINKTSSSALLPNAVGMQEQSRSAKRREAIRANRADARALVDDPLLTVREAAAERGIAVSTFWRDLKRGLLPAAFYVTPRSPRWRRSELRAAIETTPRTPGSAR